MTTVEVTCAVFFTPTLGTTTVSVADGIFDLTTIQDPNYTTGTWSGLGVTGTGFDPTGLEGMTINLFFDSDEVCTKAAPTSIDVACGDLVSPALGTATVSEADGIFDLTTIQDPNYTNGTWSGDGVTGTGFDPAGLGGTTVELFFTSAAACTEVVSIMIDVACASFITPTLGTTSVVNDSGVLDLTTLEDPNHTSGTWSGPGVAHRVRVRAAAAGDEVAGL